jgi:hypothetical protein
LQKLILGTLVDYAAGDIAHAMKKLNIQLENPEYKEVMWFPTSVSIESYSFGATDVLLHLQYIVQVDYLGYGALVAEFGKLEHLLST